MSILAIVWTLHVAQHEKFSYKTCDVGALVAMRLTRRGLEAKRHTCAWTLSLSESANVRPHDESILNVLRSDSAPSWQERTEGDENDDRAVMAAEDVAAVSRRRPLLQRRSPFTASTNERWPPRRCWRSKSHGGSCVLRVHNTYARA